MKTKIYPKDIFNLIIRLGEKHKTLVSFPFNHPTESSMQYSVFEFRIANVFDVERWKTFLIYSIHNLTDSNFARLKILIWRILEPNNIKFISIFLNECERVKTLFRYSFTLQNFPIIML